MSTKERDFTISLLGSKIFKIWLASTFFWIFYVFSVPRVFSILKAKYYSRIQSLVWTVRNIPKFKDRTSWSRDTFQPMRRRACVYQQTNQNINIAAVQWSKIFKTAEGVGQNQSSFRGSQAYFKDFSWGIHNFFKWTAYRKPYWKCLVKYSAHFVAYFFF